MINRSIAASVKDRPALSPGLRLEEFRLHYWYRAELASFCSKHGLGSDGQKHELVARVERFLDTGERPVLRSPKPAQRRTGSLTRATLVGNGFKSDVETRAFFKAQIGDRFHFTAHMQAFRRKRLAENAPLTYGHLIDEWLAEETRRKSKGYKAPIAGSWQYNQFVRDFMADKARNAGKGIGEAARAWTQIRDHPGPHSYAEYLRLPVSPE